MTVVAIYHNGRIQPASQKVTERRLKEGFYLCANAQLDAEGAIGDPTEIALMRWAMDNGVDGNRFAASFRASGEIPFDSKRKRMSTVHQTGLEKIVYVKGALESVLPLCTHLWQDGRREQLTAPCGGRSRKRPPRWQAKPLRVLVLATRSIASLDESQFEKPAVFSRHGGHDRSA